MADSGWVGLRKTESDFLRPSPWAIRLSEVFCLLVWPSAIRHPLSNFFRGNFASAGVELLMFDSKDV